MKVNNFDVLKLMGERNMNLKGFGPNNIKSINTGKKGWATLSILVDNQTALDLMLDNQPVFMLLIADKDQFKQVRAELENAT